MEANKDAERVCTWVYLRGLRKVVSNENEIGSLATLGSQPFPVPRNEYSVHHNIVRLLDLLDSPRR